MRLSFTNLLTFAMVWLLISQSSTALSQTDWERMSQDELEQFITQNKDSSNVRAYRELVTRQWSQNEFDKMRSSIRDGLKASKEYEYSRYVPFFIKRIGTYHQYAKENKDSAFHYYFLAIDTAESLQLKKEQLYAYFTTFWAYLEHDNSSSALGILDQAGDLSLQLGDTATVVDVFQLRAMVYTDLEEGRTATIWIKKAIELTERIKNTKLKGKAYGSIVSFYWGGGDLAKALNYSLLRLNVYQSINDDSQLPQLYSDISSLYDELGSYPKSLEYVLEYKDILEKQEPTADLANAYNNVGWAYKNLEEWDKAQNYFTKSYQLYKNSFAHDMSIAYPIGNLGLVCTELMQYDSAIYYSNEAAQLFNQLGFTRGVAESEVNIGNAHLGKGNSKQALIHLNEGLKLAKEAGDLYETRNAYFGLHDAYKAERDIGASLEALEQYIAVSDSLYNVEQISEAQEIESNMEQQRDEAIIDDLKTQRLIDEAELSQQRTLIFSLMVVACIVLFSMFLVFRNWRSKRKAYAKLHESHTKLEASKTKIELQKGEIEQKNLRLAEQHKDILDSINFASRIQHALLKPEEHVTEMLPPHFIFYQPRDIVSGDFYWAVHQEDYLYLAAVDCTGHGVPGAMMSMLGIAYLNEIVAENGIISPAAILDRLRNRVIKELGQESARDSHYREGMDCAIVRLHLKTNELIYAGANNPMWLVRNGDIHVYKPTKQGISYTENMLPFQEEVIKLQSNDAFYIFSDGYADQFGGEQGKKFKYSRLKELLLEIEPLPLASQRERMMQEFANWKGTMEQVDDVCVIGMRV